MWFNNGLFHCLYAGGSSGASAGIGYAYATTPGGVWTKPLTAPVLGNGHGGIAAGSFISHVGMYIEGKTIYVTGALNPFTGSLLMWSAPIDFNPATGPVFSQVGGAIMTLPAGTSLWGNTQIIPIVPGASYAMIFEALQTASSVYMSGVATASGFLGNAPAFTNQLYPLNSLITGVLYYGVNGGTNFTKEAGGPWLGAIESGNVIMYYHAGPSGSTPTDVFAAIIPLASITTDAWTVLNNGFPMIRREHQLEVDQCADPTLCQGPGGEWWAMTTAYNNLSSIANILATPCYLPTITQSNGAKVFLNRMVDNFNERAFNQGISPGANTTTFTPRNRDSVNFNLGINNVTVTLPRASYGSRIKISAFNASGGRQVTVNPSGADVLIGANTVQGGTTVTYSSENATWWTTDNPPFGSPTTGAQTYTPAAAANFPGGAAPTITGWLPYTAGGTTKYIPLMS